MIEIKNLTKKYNEVTAINNLTFNIESGSIIGFLGPNGAGKSTTMRILSGFLPPTAGNAIIEGIDVGANPFEVKKLVGYLPEDNPLYSDMTPLEYLEFCGRLRNMEYNHLKNRIKEVVDICGLSEVVVKPIAALSKGYRQRVGIAQAVLHDPPVLIMDEPTSGLDPNQIHEIRDLIMSLKGQKSIILSTHIMQEVQAVCQRVIIVNRGTIVADGTQEELASSSGKTVYRVHLDGPDGEVLKGLQALISVDTVTRGEFGFNINCAGNSDPRREIFELAVKNDWTILNLRKEQQSLEEVFRKLTIVEEK
jgi:ABC-2 type transport system ATP-binding protein